MLSGNVYPEAISNKEVGVEDRDDSLCSRHQVETASHTVAHANLDPTHQQVILNICLRELTTIESFLTFGMTSCVELLLGSWLCFSRRDNWVMLDQGGSKSHSSGVTEDRSAIRDILMRNAYIHISTIRDGAEISRPEWPPGMGPQLPVWSQIRSRPRKARWPASTPSYHSNNHQPTVLSARRASQHISRLTSCQVVCFTCYLHRHGIGNCLGTIRGESVR